MTARKAGRSFGFMNPIALIEAAAVTRRIVLGALAKPETPRRQGTRWRS